jgi:hypothetical protein
MNEGGATNFYDFLFFIKINLSECGDEEAIKINVYKYQDYSNNPVEYCGMNLSSSII